MTLPVVFTANGPSGYNLTKSLRFRSSASAYLNRTPASAGNRTTWTYSGWVKRGALGAPTKELFTASGSGEIFFGGTTDTLTIYDNSTTYLTTTQVFRDCSAYYHIVVVWDTTQATNTNRIKIYVNGVQVTAFSTASYPAQNTTSSFNNNTLHNIGQYFGGGNYYFDGYLTEVNFIDGQALTPSSFGSFNALTGVWQPAKYTGTYGTNGFYLPFTNTTSTTTLGYDFSGNGNNWTTNNISLTAGVTYDSMTDVPTLTSATTANYAVLNPLDAEVAPTSGNLAANFIASGAYVSCQRSTIRMPLSGKWYAEFNNIEYCGIALSGLKDASGNIYSATGTYLYGYTGVKAINGTQTSYAATYNFTTDVIGVAYDADVGTLTMYKNGTSQGSLATGLSGEFAFACLGSAGRVGQANFGQRPFSYTPPTGFVALNTFNLPDSTIVKGNTVMDATTYTGNGSARSIANASGFKPDLVWLKRRNSVSNHYLQDTVRGALNSLFSDSTSAQVTQAGTITSFNSNGFSLGTDAGVNQNNDTFVGWQWQAGQGTTSSNTAGSITSTVSVNPTAGFSVVTFTNPAVNFTVGHGLGVAPKMIIIKDRTNGSYSWVVYHASVGNTGALLLNSTSATLTSSSFFNNTSPTSSVFTLASAGAGLTGDSMVAYCWSEIAGFSKFGSYTSNGSSDGPFVYCGFKPRWILFKLSNAAGSWVIQDTARGTYNVISNPLYPNLSNAEGSSTSQVDVLSNGFKLRAASNINENTSTVIYAAFAESPFKVSLAR